MMRNRTKTSGEADRRRLRRSLLIPVVAVLMGMVTVSAAQAHWVGGWVWMVKNPNAFQCATAYNKFGNDPGKGLRKTRTYTKATGRKWVNTYPSGGFWSCNERVTADRITVKVRAEGWARVNGDWSRQWWTVGGNDDYITDDDGYVSANVTWAGRHVKGDRLATFSQHKYENGGTIKKNRWKEHCTLHSCN